MEVSWLVLAGMLVLSAGRAGAQGMKITPKRAESHANGSVDLMCKSEVRITGCVFSVWLIDENDKRITVLPISLENGKEAGQFHRENSSGGMVFKASYHGEGIDHGQCGLRMFDLTPGRYFVGCRVRGDTSGWTYDYMALLVHSGGNTSNIDNLNQDVADIEIVNVEKGYTGSVNFRFTTPTAECRAFYSTKSGFFNLGREFKSNPPAYEVSITMSKVKSSGVVWCLCWDGSNGDLKAFDVKIVKVWKPPKTVEVTPLTTTAYIEGNNLTAACAATNARPVARIVWKLGDDVISNDTADDNADEDRLDVDAEDDDVNDSEKRKAWGWRWPWDTKSIKQVLNRRLTLEDNGKNLTCQVSQPTPGNFFWESNSSLITVDKRPDDSSNSSKFFAANGSIIIGVLVGAVLVALISGAVIFWWKRDRAESDSADGLASDRTSFIVDNDLYQSCPDTRFANRQAAGARQSPPTENPYQELSVAPAAAPSDPPTASAARNSAIYGNTVEYQEVIIGSPSQPRRPPKKTVAAETVIYAEVRAPLKTVAPESVVYAQVLQKKDRPKR